jgi:hypothetical protein
VAITDLRDRRLDRVDLLFRDLGLALHVPGHDHRAPVLRDLIGVLGVERRLEVLDRRIPFHRPDDVVDGRAEGRIGDGAHLALHEHELRLRIRLWEPCAQDLVGLV